MSDLTCVFGGLAFLVDGDGMYIACPGVGYDDLTTSCRLAAIPLDSHQYGFGSNTHIILHGDPGGEVDTLTMT